MSTYISDTDYSKVKLSSPPIETIKGKLADYDFHAPYQRFFLYTKFQQENLIKSIFGGIPCGAVHLVQHANDTRWDVLDGKQRLLTIKRYINNEFAVEWEGKSYYYRDLTKNPTLYHRFNDYTIQMVSWEPMPVLAAREIFARINANCPLSSDEQRYCNNFFTKGLLDYIWNVCIQGNEGRIEESEEAKGLARHMRKEYASNRRFKGYNWAHHICHWCFGPLFNQTRGNVVGFTSKVATTSSHDLDHLIQTHLGDDLVNRIDSENNFIDDDLVKKMGMKDNLTTLSQTCQKLCDILEYRNNCVKKLAKNDVLDIVYLLIDLIQQKRLRLNQLDPSLYDAILDEVIVPFTGRDTAQKSAHTTTLSVIDERHKILLSHFSKIQLDLGIKESGVSASDKTSALLRSGCQCPVCGVVLTDGNVEIDHVQAKSKFSESIKVAICASCNRRKSDWTDEEMCKYQKYIKDASGSASLRLADKEMT